MTARCSGGFTASPTVDDEQHRSNIRGLLATTDPETGDIEDD